MDPGGVRAISPGSRSETRGTRVVKCNSTPEGSQRVAWFGRLMAPNGSRPNGAATPPGSECVFGLGTGGGVAGAPQPPANRWHPSGMKACNPRGSQTTFPLPGGSIMSKKHTNNQVPARQTLAGKRPVAPADRPSLPIPSLWQILVECRSECQQRELSSTCARRAIHAVC